jgi:hypothetical protein
MNNARKNIFFLHYHNGVSSTKGQNVAKKRTFSLSQMTKAKFVSALAWREKVHEYEPMFMPRRSGVTWPTKPV